MIKQLVNSRDGFEMVSGNMRASVEESKMPKLLNLLGERFSLSVKIPRHYYNEYLDKGTKQHNPTDSLTQQAMQMFEQDKKEFPKRLAEQKQAIPKAKSISIDKGKHVITSYSIHYTKLYDLGLKIVAEGIETVKQLHYLEEVDCDAIQGYYYAKPLEISALIRFLTKKEMDTGQ